MTREAVENAVRPMLTALRERIAKDDLPPVTGDLRCLVYSNHIGERLFANDCIIGGGPSVHMEILIAVQPDDRLMWWESYMTREFLEDAHEKLASWVASLLFAAIKATR